MFNQCYVTVPGFETEAISSLKVFHICATSRRVSSGDLRPLSGKRFVELDRQAYGKPFL
jgi:hypothetical protein